MLIKLNYNTPAFIHWLIQKLEEKVAAQHTISHKLYYIMSELILYELLPCPAEGYIPAERSVQEVMADLLQKKYNLLQNMPVLPAETAAVGAAKLHTALSVPQLALFVRLLVDTKVINENNNLALLRHVASVVSTEKAATPSPESLKVNYYTPGNAAKHIVRDYLLNMVNLLRRY